MGHTHAGLRLPCSSCDGRRHRRAAARQCGRTPSSSGLGQALALEPAFRARTGCRATVTHPDVTLPEQGPVVVASDEAVEPAVPPRVPEVGEETRLERPDNTYPELLDRARAERTIRDQYPLELQEAGIGGLVTLRVWVGSDGTVTRRRSSAGRVCRSSTRGARHGSQPALRAARRFGEPVGTWVNFDLAFEPSEDSPAPLPPRPSSHPRRRKT